MKSIVYFLILFVLFFSSCTEDVREYTGNIQGIVTESGTTNPISGVQVSVVNLGTSTTTGGDGQFRFSDVEAETYQLQFKKIGYITDTREVRVLVGETAKCDMQLVQERNEAEIEFEPSILNFGTTQTELSLTMTNHGNVATEWSLDLGNNTWLTASPLSGNITANKTQSIVFKVNRNKLSEPKNVKVALSAFGNSYAISVSCAPINAKSEMSITPTSIDFGGNMQEGNISIENTGNAPLTWNISGITEECITVSATEGTIEPEGSKVIKLMLDRTKLTKDLNTSFIISDGIREQIVTVKATKAVARMEVSPLSLDFGEEATEKIFTISNTGTAKLLWNITVPAGTGLKVSEVSGVIEPLTTKQITVTLDRSLMPETLNTELEVSDGTNKKSISVKATKGNDTSGAVVAQGLYAYYKFDGNFSDATENEINGFGTASPDFVEGVNPEGKAVKFSKTDNSTFVVSKPIIDSREMTISFWGKDFSDGHIFHLNSSVRNEAMFTLSVSNGSLKFIVTRYDNMHQYNNFPSFVHPTITDGKWHHVVLTSDFNKTQYATITTTLFIDGMEIYTLTEDANPFSENGYEQSSYDTDNSFTMGGSLRLNNSITLPATNMSVDNFRVYDTRRLSSKEIKEIYNAKQ